jgi:CRISPR-associated protein Cmr2
MPRKVSGFQDSKYNTNFELLSSFKLREDVSQSEIDDVLRGKQGAYRNIDWYSRISILNQSYQKKGRVISGSHNGKLDLCKFYELQETHGYLEQQREHIRTLQLESAQVKTDLYPEGTFLIRFDFTLANPYISKDDVEFHIVDNPVRKEWVFKVPYVSGSQWKGALHHAMVKSLAENHDESNVEDFIHERRALTRIFGTEKRLDTDTQKAGIYLDKIGGSEASEAFREKLREIFDSKEDEIPMISGRVILYPTYFDSIALEVINPHSEEVRGDKPIYFETVPADSKGTFCLLYVPLTQGWGNDFRDIRRDLELTKRGIYDLMLTYGFGAKTSLGYGRTKSVVKGEEYLKTSTGIEKMSFTNLDSLLVKDTISEEG